MPLTIRIILTSLTDNIVILLCNKTIFFYEFQIKIDPQSKHMFMSTNVDPKYISLYRYRFNFGFRPTDDYFGKVDRKNRR